MNQPLSATITRLRKERGLTQAVSKWEKGGAPDVELLPVLADRLGVSMDALFGRADPSTADMTTQFQQWLLSIPLEQRFSALFELLAATSTCLGSNLMNSGIFPSMTLGSTCYVDNIVPNATSRTWLRAYVKSEEGLLLGVLAKDFPLYLLMPEPPGRMPKALLCSGTSWRHGNTSFPLQTRRGLLPPLCHCETHRPTIGRCAVRSSSDGRV